MTEVQDEAAASVTETSGEEAAPGTENGREESAPVTDIREEAPAPVAEVRTDAQPLVRPRVLKHRNTFGVFDPHGEIIHRGLGEQGLYHLDMRHLSHFTLRLEGKRPLLLSSTVTHGNFLLAVDLANPEVEQVPEMKENSLHVFRGRFLRDGVLYEEMRFTNYGDEHVSVPCRLDCDADYRDLFEVRGRPREERGETLPVEADDAEVALGYRGLDGYVRTTRIALTGPNVRSDGKSLLFQVDLAPGREVIYEITVHCDVRVSSDLEPSPLPAGRSGQSDARRTDDYTTARHGTLCELETRRTRFVQLRTSNEQFNDWWNRSMDDVNLLISELTTGPYPFAGIPWFAAPFGRDGIITALEVLWVAPFVAKGVLQLLAETQASAVEPERDAEPGKILHEARAGEMSNLGEVPFGRYYGSVDSTPLFVLLAAAYWRRTGDEETIRGLLPAIDAALEWMDEYGDADGDGLLEYLRKRPGGLANQSWKDSDDSMFHADGTFAAGPIVPLEVQAYAFAARNEIAELFSAFDRKDAARSQKEAAERTRGLVEEKFWSERLGTYAMALDGEKRPLMVRSSNAGHVLFGGLASPGRAERTASLLMSDDLFSGWGIRTVAAKERRYNPMSYHNGSVWPHDNALIASGMSRYGHTDHCAAILTSLFDVSLFSSRRRLPELFCGFHRRPGEAPVTYPVACAPQAWAAGAVGMLLQSCLGIRLDAVNGVVAVHRPRIPPYMSEVTVQDLTVGSGRVDLTFRRVGGEVDVQALPKEGNVDVKVTKL